jgi:hypothetical protein
MSAESKSQDFDIINSEASCVFDLITSVRRKRRGGRDFSSDPLSF